MQLSGFGWFMLLVGAAGFIGFVATIGSIP